MKDIIVICRTCGHIGPIRDKRGCGCCEECGSMHVTETDLQPEPAHLIIEGGDRHMQNGYKRSR